MSNDPGLARGCFVCGDANPAGLGVRFALSEERCVGTFVPESKHMGYDGVTHGGILFALLDDVMANWLWLRGEACFTAKADVRYRRQLPIGERVTLESTMLRRKGPLVMMSGRVLGADGNVVAEATASFMKAG